MGRKILAVFVGLFVDIVFSLLMGLALGLALTAYLVTHGVTTHDLVPRVTALSKSAPMMLAAAGLGSFGSLVGGFLTGWIARSSRVACGAIMGACSVLAGLPFWYAEPLWYNVLGAVVTLVIATAGAWLAEAIFSRAPTLAA